MNKTPDSNLLIFSKYPTTGKAKTRLIPALGAEAAAQLHRRLAKSAIDVARSWGRKTQRETHHITVHYSGAGEADFYRWLGADLDYQEQPTGDLGQRMGSAFKSAFEGGTKHVIGIGTDVPTLTAAILQQADKNLEEHDLVLGPAADGGYYLIGLKTFQPELFTNINWGTEHVLRQTLEIGTRLGLKVSVLQILNDVDRPEDLVQLKGDSRFSALLANR